MMSERIYLNNDWKFAEQFEASMTEAAYDDSTMQNVRLPHTCKETPLHYFDEHCYQMISGYRRVIEAEKAWEGKKILLTIDGAAHDSEVFLNGDTYLQNGQFSLKGNSSNAITKNLCRWLAADQRVRECLSENRSQCAAGICRKG